MVRLFWDQTKIPFIPKFRTGKTILGLGGQINYLHSIMHNAFKLLPVRRNMSVLFVGYIFVLSFRHGCVQICQISDHWVCHNGHYVRGHTTDTVTLKIYLQPTKHIFCTVWDSLWHIFDTATRWIYSIYLVWWRSSLMQTIATLQPASDILRVVIIIICDWLQVM